MQILTRNVLLGRVLKHVHDHNSSLITPKIGVDRTKISGWKIVREMFKYIWPKDKPHIRRSVMVCNLHFVFIPYSRDSLVEKI